MLTSRPQALPSPELGLRLLAFDGGGLRAISQALIVRDMFHRLEEDHQLSRPPKVSDHFDMICGSGLGGLLAIMCGILDMTGDQLVEEFVGLCKAVFSEQLDIAQRTSQLEKEMKRIVAKFSEGREERKMLGEEGTCKTFVCAAPAHNASHARLFRNYRSRLNASPNYTLWEAGRATTAIPGLFSPISIGPEHIGETFVSGELGWNNPMDQLTEEAALFFKDRHISCIINIGSGHLGHLSLSNSLSGLFSRIALDCERVVERMERRFGEVPGVYRRLSVEQGMQKLDVKLVNLHEVVAHTQSYLQRSRVARNIDSLLEDLALRPERIRAHAISGVVPGIVEAIHPKVCPQPTPYFTGRQAELNTLEEYFASDSDSCLVGVLYGIGGGGKTQIGLRFIQLSQNRLVPLILNSARPLTFLSRFSEVFFIDASDKISLENDLKALVSRIVDRPSVDDAISLLRSRREEWLLFLDNADDTTMDLRPYVAWPHGNVLITTRNRGVRAHSPKCSIWVDRLELKDATELLLRGVDAPKTLETHETAIKIVHELGYIALAINHARAFLANGICAVDEYLPIYACNREKLLDNKLIQSTDDYKHSIYTTFTLSFNKLSTDAALLLRLLSNMHHESIPCRLFRDAWEAWQSAVHEKEDLAPPRAVTLLSAFHTLKRKEFNELPRTVVTFISRFIAVDSTWDVLHFRTLLGYRSCHTNTSLSATTIGKSSRDYAVMISLLPHLQQSTKTGVHLHYTFLPLVGHVYRHGGLFQECLIIRQRSLSEAQQQLGSGHLVTLMCMSHLANIYWDLGQHQESLNLNEEVVELSKRVLGLEHPDTLTAISDLALSYSNLGHYQNAVKLNEEDAYQLDEKVVQLQKQILGNDHPDTLLSMSNLALSQSNLGLYHAALTLNEELLELRKRILGYTHPDTLTSLNSIAHSHLKLGQYLLALKVNEEVVELRKQVLGREHPDTLLSMNNLVQVYSALGRHQESLAVHEQLTQPYTRVLGIEHPDALRNMSNLALSYSNLSQYDDAQKLNGEVLKLRKRVLGDRHPETLVSMSNLAWSYLTLGRHEDALKLNVETLQLMKQVLGTNYPDTLNSMGNLAWTYSRLGRRRDALRLGNDVLQLSRRILGHEHPTTIDILNWMNGIQRRQLLDLSIWAISLLVLYCTFKAM
ncbi:hypothetical protein DL96DRAFT_1757614 [Flagelloscypha sp. PMI_526]|nr:hypothetical protein DL96DRAFT_1757614 [Flagelloscypha sp. PMI_526]